jgi:serine/threonine protein kinase
MTDVDPAGEGDRDLPATLVMALERACDRFEAAWKAGRRPRLEDYLGEMPEAGQPALVRELLLLDVALRRDRGERPTAEEYRARFPGHGDLIDEVFREAPKPHSGPPQRTRRRRRAADPAREAGRNLLFGVLALQNDFISRDDLVAAFAVWVADKARPLGQVLVDRGALDEARRALLEALAGEHLQQHGGDPAASLAAVSSLGSVRDDLGQLADPDLQASLSTATSRATVAGGAAEATASYAGTSTGGGGRFRILRPHAQGGLGQISVALDEELHREVALKELQPRHAADPTSRSRFVQEAEITGGLEHPGIVPVYGLGHYDDGRPFYAMRFIKGDSLKDAIVRFHEADRGSGRDPGERAVALQKLLRRYLDVCDAIAYAHSRGVLHRDLKPGNIMVGQYGETLVVDWGLAKLVGRAESAAEVSESTLHPASTSGLAETLPGSMIGTPAYMSPEQAAGDLGRIGRASDVYSLGATLYALLTGKPPIESPDVGEVLRRVQAGEIPSPRQVNPRIPPALESICRKAMALRPEQRFASPRALAHDIERWLADEPVAAHPERWTTKSWRWARRHPTWSMWIVATGLTDCVVLLVLLTILSFERLVNLDDRSGAFIGRLTILLLVSPLLVALASQVGGMIGMLCGAALGMAKRRTQTMALRGATLGVKSSLILASACILLSIMATLGLWAMAHNKPLGQRITLEEDPYSFTVSSYYKQLSQCLATSPSPRNRDPAEAVRLASLAVKTYPSNPFNWGTLGVAQYHAGNWDGAITALGRAMEGYPYNGSLAPLLRPSRAEVVEELFLAMAYYQKGNHSKAREWYDHSVSRKGKVIEAPLNRDYEFINLSSLRAEARELIDGIN